MAGPTPLSHLTAELKGVSFCGAGGAAHHLQGRHQQPQPDHRRAPPHQTVRCFGWLRPESMLSRHSARCCCCAMAPQALGSLSCCTQQRLSAAAWRSWLTSDFVTWRVYQKADSEGSTDIYALHFPATGALPTGSQHSGCATSGSSRWRNWRPRRVSASPACETSSALA